MIERFAEVRGRIHAKADSYFVFERYCTRKKNQFFGATDALFDTNISASDFRDAFRAAPNAGILLCYGFLQALYVQQDALQTLSKAVGLDWKPDDDPELSKIRDIRNRLCHPAESGERKKNGRISSAIIPQHSISEPGFIGAIYYDDKFENVSVDVDRFLSLNQERLLEQMLKAEVAMDDQERAFRQERSADHFAICFEDGFSYLLERLHCALENEDRRIQAKSHADMITKRLIELQEKLRSRDFAYLADSSSFSIVTHGITLLIEIFDRDNASVESQYKFDLIYAGVKIYMEDLARDIRSLDAKLNTPV
ncbi:MAG: hypothetical protein WA733_17480 [Methylocystis sp.]